jgi:hypothetical protein
MTYHDHMRQYRRFKAVKDWKNALVEVEAAIQVCEVDEALPVLTAFRDEVAAQIKPQPWWMRLMGVRA